MDKPRIIFMGTPEFACPAFEALLAQGYEIAAAYCQPDRPHGRGQKLTAPPVKTLAASHGIPVLQPETLKAPEALDALKALRGTIGVVAAFGLLLPQRILDALPLGFVNIHGSILPRWRGAAPIQRAIEAGDAETGVSIMKLVLKMDAGPVYTARALPLAGGETAGEVFPRVAALGADLLVETLPGILDGSRAPVPQNDALATYAPMLTKAEAALDLRRPARVLHNQVRAFNPWPGAEIRLHGERIKIHRTALRPGSLPPGVGVIESGQTLLAGTGEGILEILELQREGKPRIGAAAFATGLRGTKELRFDLPG